MFFVGPVDSMPGLYFLGGNKSQWLVTQNVNREDCQSNEIKVLF